MVWKAKGGGRVSTACRNQGRREGVDKRGAGGGRLNEAWEEGNLQPCGWCKKQAVEGRAFLY